MNIALIGFGRIALTHLAGFGGLDRSSVVAVVEPKIIPRWVARRLGYPTFSSIAEVAAAGLKVDLSVICTPSFVHETNIAECSSLASLIFVEKPLAGSAAQAERILQLAQQKGLWIWVGYVNRFLPTFGVLREMLRGEVVHAAKIQGLGPTVAGGNYGWRDNYAQGGGVLFDYAPHVFDIVFWLFGATDRILDLKARKHVSNNVHDEIDVRLGYEHFAVDVTVNWAKREERKARCRLEVETANYRFECEKEQMLIISKVDGTTEVVSALEASPDIEFYLRGEEFAHQAQAVRDHVHGRNTLQSNLVDAVKVDKLIGKIFEEISA